MKLTYIDAYFYKLLLQIGFSEDVNNWINDIAENSDTLEGIYLDLVSNQGDDSSVISVLHNYICENDIEWDTLAIRLRLFILDKYENGDVDLFKASEALVGFLSITENYHIKSFEAFSFVGYGYDLMLEGIIRKDEYEKKFINYLITGNPLNYDSFSHHISFRELLKKEKEEMNKVRAFVNYKVVPFLVLFTIIIFLTVLILCSINEDKYIIFSVCLLVLLGIMYVLLIALIPFINKKSYQLELARYDFTIDDITKEEYIVQIKEYLTLIFKKDGLYVMNKHYKYEDLKIELFTSNVNLKVNLFVYISVKKCKNYINIIYHTLLNKDIVNAIAKYNIKLKNHDEYIYIINNKEDAFKQILKNGNIEE